MGPVEGMKPRELEATKAAGCCALPNAGAAPSKREARRMGARAPARAGLGRENAEEDADADIDAEGGPRLQLLLLDPTRGADAGAARATSVRPPHR
jgi:hypothetical protein